MIEYEVCEINQGHFIKVLKCSSDSESLNKPEATIVIIPGINIKTNPLIFTKLIFEIIQI